MSDMTRARQVTSQRRDGRKGAVGCRLSESVTGVVRISLKLPEEDSIRVLVRHRCGSNVSRELRLETFAGGFGFKLRGETERANESESEERLL